VGGGSERENSNLSGRSFPGRVMGEGDIVPIYLLFDQVLWVWLDSLIGGSRFGCGERGNDIRLASAQIPEIAKIAGGENDEVAVVYAGVGTGLLFAGEIVFVFRLRFQDDERKAAHVEQ
jgi:hypothetical protein